MKCSAKFKVALLATFNTVFWVDITLTLVSTPSESITLKMLIVLFVLASLVTWCSMYWLVGIFVQPIFVIANEIERMSEVGNFESSYSIYGDEYKVLIDAVKNALESKS